MVVAVPLAAVASPSTSIVVAVGLVTLARVRSISRQRAEARRAVVQAPSVVDLLGLCLDAGLTPRLAIERVAPLVPPPLGPELATAVGRCARGAAFVDAIGDLTMRGHPLRTAALAIAAAERSGAPLAGALDRVATEARAAVRRSTEERARRLPVVMLLPLVTCVLPAFGLLAIAPLLLGRLGDLL
jgi:Flp pilus assembly protein TadB